MALPTESVRRRVIDAAKCVVVKVGTRVLTTADGKLDVSRVDTLAAQLCRIADSGRQTIMVSSGAVGAGVAKLGLPKRPSGIATLQAVAAIGQADLIGAYESSFQKRGRHAAQVLLTKGDLLRRSGYLHVRNALNGIHDFGAIAVINENDSVAVAELKTTFGDNDRLAAHVSGLFNDALLILLSDISGLYDGPPSDPNSRRIELVRDLNDGVMSLAVEHKSSVSKGGMTGKLRAAKLATSHGHPVIIGPGTSDDVLDQIFRHDPVGTLFLPSESEKKLRGRRRWLAGAATIAGTLHLDAGAVDAIQNRGRSLLAIGITNVTGVFPHGSVVDLVGPDGREIGRGLCNYRSSEVSSIVGQPSEKIQDILGHRPYENVVHRNNLVLNVIPD